MNELKQQISALKQEQESLGKRISELESIANQQPEKKGRWKPIIGEEFWYINYEGSVDKEPWKNTRSDNYNYLLGNCFECGEEAVQRLNQWIFEQELRDFAETVNEGWEWKPGETYYAVILKIENGKEELFIEMLNNIRPMPRFSYEGASKAIDHFGQRYIDYLKGWR